MSTTLTDTQITAGAAVLAGYKDLSLNWRNAAIDVFDAMMASALAPEADTVDAIVRDVCELDYTGENWDHESMLSVMIDDLKLICKRHLCAALDPNQRSYDYLAGIQQGIAEERAVRLAQELTSSTTPVAELAHTKRHTYATIIDGMIGKYRDDNSTEYVTLADAEAAVRAACAAHPTATTQADSMALKRARAFVEAMAECEIPECVDYKERAERLLAALDSPAGEHQQ